MSTPEEQRTLKLLVQNVGRAFYDPRYTVVLDQLVRKEAMQDGELAGRIGLPVKDTTKVVAKLVADKLVSMYRRNEYQPPNPRPLPKTYWYIDYQLFVDVVKWRMYKIRSDIDSKLRNELDQKGWICPTCKKSFSGLDVLHLEASLDTFLCDVCGYGLVDNENADSVRGSKDRMARLLKQSQVVVDGLKKTESMVLPAFNVADWVNKNVKMAAAPQSEAGDGLAIAGEGGRGQAQQAQVRVELVNDDAETRTRKLAEEAEARRQQNALPDWHLRSTISGDLTSLGYREGAGGAGARPSTSALAGASAGEDVKPDVSSLSETFDFSSYYATLSASASPSTSLAPTPSLSGRGGDASSSSEEDDFEEVSAAPSAPLADPHVNANGKRGRPHNAGAGASRSPELKRVKVKAEPTEEVMPPPPVPAPAAGGAVGGANGVNDDDDDDYDDDDFEEVGGGGGGGGDPDTLVSVGGLMIPFSQITDEQTSSMTAEEYAAYWSVFQAING